MSDHYRDTLALHAGMVSSAEDDLATRRSGMRFWMLEAVDRGGLSVEEVVDIVGSPVEHVILDIGQERKWRATVKAVSKR